MSLIQGGIYSDLLHSNGRYVYSAFTAMTAFTIATYTTVGSYTFITPSNLMSLSADCIGGGGSGGLTNTATVNGGLGGGGGGGYALGTITPVAGDVYNINVGSGGTGLQGTNRQGGDSSFGSIAIARGGAGGAVNGGGLGVGGGTGGAGGTNVGSVTYHGGNGGAGIISSAPQTGGGGGGAGNGGHGGNGGTDGGSGVGGAGGIGAAFGGGDGADGAAYTTSPIAIYANGINAPNSSGPNEYWGGGGSGGYNRLSAHAVNGGNGKNGGVWVYGTSAYTYWEYVLV